MVLSIRVASAVADILVHEGGVPTADAQLIMDRLADGLEASVRDGYTTHTQLVRLLAELRLVTDVRSGETEDDHTDYQ